MIDRLICHAQIGLSYVIFLGYIGMKVATGLGYLQPLDDGALKEILLLIAFFWFQRQRPTQPTEGATTP